MCRLTAFRHLGNGSSDQSFRYSGSGLRQRAVIAANPVLSTLFISSPRPPQTPPLPLPLLRWWQPRPWGSTPQAAAPALSSRAARCLRFTGAAACAHRPVSGPAGICQRTHTVVAGHGKGARCRVGRMPQPRPAAATRWALHAASFAVRRAVLYTSGSRAGCGTQAVTCPLRMLPLRVRVRYTDGEAVGEQ